MKYPKIDNHLFLSDSKKIMLVIRNKFELVYVINYNI